MAANPLSNLDSNFGVTGVTSAIGFWSVSGIDGAQAGYVFHPPINPSFYNSNPPREQSTIKIIDGGDIRQHPPNQDDLVRTFGWAEASEAFYSGLKPFDTPAANGQRGKVFIFDAGFNIASGVKSEIVDVRKEVIPGKVPLRFTVEVDYILRDETL